jgi:hypothetical protein
MAETGHLGLEPEAWALGEDFETVVAALLARCAWLERYSGLDQHADVVARFGDFRAA